MDACRSGQNGRCEGALIGVGAASSRPPLDLAGGSGASRGLSPIGASRTTPTREDAERLVKEVGRWHQDFEIHPGVWTGGAYKPQFWWEWMALPARLEGVRVFDIGPSDGYFSLEAAKRGADLTCIDYQPRTVTGFWAMEPLYGRPFEFIQANLYDLQPSRLAAVDVMLFLGVLPHLPDPYRALALLAEMTKPGGRIFVETVYATGIDEASPLMRFYKGKSLTNDMTNFWTQTPACLRDMLEDVGFRTLREHKLGSNNTEWGRIIVEAVREPDPDSERRKNVA